MHHTLRSPPGVRSWSIAMIAATTMVRPVPTSRSRRDPEAVADLDQLTAGDHDCTAGRQRAADQHRAAEADPGVARRGSPTSTSNQQTAPGTRTKYASHH
jgi:hypothetical protein